MSTFTRSFDRHLTARSLEPSSDSKRQQSPSRPPLGRDSSTQQPTPTTTPDTLHQVPHYSSLWATWRQNLSWQSQPADPDLSRRISLSTQRRLAQQLRQLWRLTWRPNLARHSALRSQPSQVARRVRSGLAGFKGMWLSPTVVGIIPVFLPRFFTVYPCTPLTVG